ncbi:MAG: hypothetical protein AAB403_02640, partial [Planctomycetota bacterium]
GRIVGGGSLCLLLTAQDAGTDYPVQVAGPPLILQGYIPAGAPGGAWSKVQIDLPPGPQPRTPNVTSHVEQALRRDAFRHDKKPSRSSERAARPLKTGLVRR